MDQIHKFNKKFQNLQYELTVAKQVDSVLSERLVYMNRQCWANAQYSRRECLELIGVLRIVTDGDLKEKVLKIFEKIAFPIEGNNIEVCYCITKKINKWKDNSQLSTPKDFQDVLNAKKELKKLEMKEIGFVENNCMFANQILGRYYHVSWSKAKPLHSLKKISRTYVSGDTVKSIKIVRSCQ